MFEFDYLFKDYYIWLKGQYDKESGGFYYARSSIKPLVFSPDIESTAQAINILNESNLLKDMPVHIKNGLINFFKGRQREDGYFLDPHNNMYKVDRMVARALSYSTGKLAMLGATPQYKTPGTTGKKDLPQHLQTLENLKKWLEERPWDYAWMACDNISAAAVYPIEENLLQYTLQFLEKRQDKETGMWGEGRPYIKISGAFKLALMYNRLNLKMPRVEQVYDYIKYTLQNDQSEDFCWSRNVMDLIGFIRPQLPEIQTSEKEQILSITWNNISRYLKSDGGFSRHIKSSLKTPNNVQLGLGLKEGDMNAGTQALKVRTLSLKWLDKKVEPLKELTRGFYTNL